MIYLDIAAVKKIIPHRYPILLLDKACITQEQEIAQGWKAVTQSEPFLQGHFPNDPIMPGVLQIEAMAQLCALLAGYNDQEGKIMLLASVNKARFSKKVIPGMVMHIHTQCIAARQHIKKFTCFIEVDGVKVSEAEIVGALASADA